MLQKELKDKLTKDDKEIDSAMILKAKEGLELEKKHREDLQKKALASKTMRDKILMEAALKKGKDQSKTKEEEANHVKKLYIEI